MVGHWSCLEQKRQLGARGRKMGKKRKQEMEGKQKWKDKRESNQEVLIKLQQTLRVSELRGNPMRRAHFKTSAGIYRSR